MSALRYSGELRIRVTYLEPGQGREALPKNGNGRYRCFVRAPGNLATTVIVGAPKFLSVPVDSPEAFDDAARAAINFADHEREPGDDRFGELAAQAGDGSGYLIARRESDAWGPHTAECVGCAPPLSKTEPAPPPDMLDAHAEPNPPPPAPVPGTVPPSPPTAPAEPARNTLFRNLTRGPLTALGVLH